MPYRKISEFSKLPLVPLSVASVAICNELEERASEIDYMGIAGLIDALPPGEKFERLMAEGRYIASDNRPSPEDSLLMSIFNEDHIEHHHIRDAEKAGLSPKTSKAICDLALAASGVLADRIRKNFSVADSVEQEAFRKIVPKELDYELLNPEGELHSPDHEGRNELRELNAKMEYVSHDPQVTDKMQRACEAIYTMATADVPMTYNEALVQVSKITLIAPKRGGATGRKA